MDYQKWRMSFDVVQLLFTIGVWIYAVRQARSKASESRLKEIEDRATKVESRIAKVEGDRGVCSNHGRMEATDRAVLKKLDEIGGGVATIAGRLEGINRMVDLLTQNELSGGSK